MVCHCTVHLRAFICAGYEVAVLGACVPKQLGCLSAAHAALRAAVSTKRRGRASPPALRRTLSSSVPLPRLTLSNCRGAACSQQAVYI